MPTLSPKIITEYLLGGSKKEQLMIEAKQTIASATDYAEAQANLMNINTAIQSHKIHESNEYSSTVKGALAGAVVGAAIGATPFVSPISASIFRQTASYAVGFSVLGGTGGMGIDRIKEKTTGTQIKKNMEMIEQLATLAQEKLRSFGAEESKEIATGLRHR